MTDSTSRTGSLVVTFVLAAIAIGVFSAFDNQSQKIQEPSNVSDPAVELELCVRPNQGFLGNVLSILAKTKGGFEQQVFLLKNQSGAFCGQLAVPQSETTLFSDSPEITFSVIRDVVNILEFQVQFGKEKRLLAGEIFGRYQIFHFTLTKSQEVNVSEGTADLVSK